MTNATASEISMPMLALIGIGLMYGPISPLTKAIGNNAAITVRVASMVGLPTSSTASGMISDSGWCCASARRRWMFSTTTIASSTSIPMEKISANSDTRFSVNPYAQEANKRRRQRQQHGDADHERLAPPHAQSTPARPRQPWRTSASGSASSPCRWRSRHSCAWW